MIRFSAGLVVLAIGVLIGGIATSKLLLVYVAIGLSGAALLALAIGVVLKRAELFGEQRQVLAPAGAGMSSIQPNGAVDTLQARVPAAASTAFGEAFPGSGGGSYYAPPGAPPPISPWRERLSLPDGDPPGPAASSRPGQDSSAPGAPSWFDRSARPARGVTPTEEPTPRVPAETETPSAGTDTAAEDDASADAEPALSATAEAAEVDRPADPESSSGPEPPASDSVPAKAAGAGDADEADAADGVAGSGERRDDEPPAGRERGSGQVTVVPGVPRYHKQNCILIRFMTDEDVQKMTIQEAAETGCIPCRACQPDPA